LLSMGHFACDWHGCMQSPLFTLFFFSLSFPLVQNSIPQNG
jgi:hypothetical protein